MPRLVFRTMLVLLFPLPLVAADWTTRLLEARKLTSEGAYRAAVTAYQEAAAMAVAIQETPVIVAGIRCELGFALWEAGQPTPALAEMSTALRAIRSSGEPIPIGVCTNHLALYYRGAGQYEEARKLFAEVLTLAEKTGRKIPQANTLLNLAGLELLSGHNADAEQKARQALQILDGQVGAVGPQLLEAYSLLALAARAQQRPVEAIRHAEHEIFLRNKIGERKPAEMLRVLSLIATANAELKRLRRAAEFAGQIDAILAQRPLLPGDVKISSLTALAFVDSQRGDLQKAEQSLMAILPLLEEIPDLDGLTAGTVWTHLGRVRRRQGNLTGSEQCHQTALKVLQRSMPQQPMFTAFAYLDLADTYRLMRRYEDAVGHYRQGLTKAEQILGKANGALAIDYGMFASVLLKTKAKAEAQKYQELAKEARNRSGDLRALGYTVDIDQLGRKQ